MMSGVVLWTTDIGGYWDGDATTPEFQELIGRFTSVSLSTTMTHAHALHISPLPNVYASFAVRWFQFGAFSPLFR